MAGDHRGTISRRAVIAVGVVWIVTTVGAWVIGRAGDEAIALANSHSALVVQSSADYAPDVTFPYVLNADELQAYANAHNATGGQAFDAEHGAVGVGLDFDAVVYGDRNHPLIVTSIRAVHVQCFQASNSWMRISYEQGGGLPELPGTVELVNGKDSVDIPDSGPTLKPWHFPRQVSNSDADDYQIGIEPPPNDVCSFEPEFDYTDAGKKQELLVTSNGRPYRIAGTLVGKVNGITSDQVPQPQV